MSLARSKMAMVRLPRALLKKLTFYYLLPLRGREPHFRFGVPANQLASLSFPFRCPATWGHLSANIWSPVWPTFLPKGHFLTAWYSHSIREDSISLTSSSPWAITWHKQLKNIKQTLVNNNFYNKTNWSTNKTISPSSSSSYRAGSTDIPDPLSPLLPIVHRPR